MKIIVGKNFETLFFSYSFLALFCTFSLVVFSSLDYLLTKPNMYVPILHHKLKVKEYVIVENNSLRED